MTLQEKYMKMRNAIDAIDLALHGDNKIKDAAKLFDDADDDLVVKVAMTAGNLRQIRSALDECNRIINSDDFRPLTSTTKT